MTIAIYSTIFYFYYSTMCKYTIFLNTNILLLNIWLLDNNNIIIIANV